MILAKALFVIFQELGYIDLLEQEEIQAGIYAANERGDQERVGEQRYVWCLGLHREAWDPGLKMCAVLSHEEIFNHGSSSSV